VRWSHDGEEGDQAAPVAGANGHPRSPAPAREGDGRGERGRLAAAAPMKATLALLALVAVAIAAGLPACHEGPLVLIDVSRTEMTTDGKLIVILNRTQVDHADSVPLTSQRLRRGYRVVSDNPKICVRLEFFSPPSAQVATDSREALWAGEPLTWIVGGANGPIGTSCSAGAGGIDGAAGARPGSGGAGAVGGRGTQGVAGQGGTSTAGSGGSAGGPAPSGGTIGQGGGPVAPGGSPGSSGGAVGSGGTSGASGASGGRGGQPASSGGMMMTGSGGGLGGRGMGSGGAMSSGGAGGMGGITSMGGATSTGGMIVTGTGGGVPTGGAGANGATGGAGGRGTAGAGGMTGNGGRSGGSGGAGGGAPVPICSNTNTVPCTCAGYCATINAYCTSSMLFPGPPDECSSICSGFGWREDDVYSGRSALPCRMNLIRTGPAQQCRDASPVGGGAGNPCGTHCQVLCDTVDHNCAALSSPPYADKNDCLTKCMTTPFGFEPGERLLTSSMPGQGQDGNCHLYWAAYAGTLPLADRGDACANTAPGSATCQ